MERNILRWIVTINEKRDFQDRIIEMLKEETQNL